MSIKFDDDNCKIEEYSAQQNCTKEQYVTKAKYFMDNLVSIKEVDMGDKLDVTF